MPIAESAFADRPIDSFQALKYRMADLLMKVESLRSAVASGAAAAYDSDVVPSLALLAKAYASNQPNAIV